MIFKVISIYFKAKKGIKDPQGFAVEEAQDVLTGAMIIPLLVLIGVTILLGILSFSHIIAAPSVLAQIFFWIFVVVFVGYLSLVLVIRSLVGKIIRKIGEKIQNP
jgi:hypothetical protein